MHKQSEDSGRCGIFCKPRRTQAAICPGCWSAQIVKRYFYADPAWFPDMRLSRCCNEKTRTTHFRLSSIISAYLIFLTQSPFTIGRMLGIRLFFAPFFSVKCVKIVRCCDLHLAPYFAVVEKIKYYIPVNSYYIEYV